MQEFTKDSLPPLAEFTLHRKKVLARMVKIDGPFSVQTKEGTLSRDDGWLALDSDGYPYPISSADYDMMYEEA